MTDFSENGLWEFLRQSKANSVCLGRYTDLMRAKERRSNKWIPILLIVCSLGTLSSIWIPYIAPIAASILTALIAVGAVIKDYAPQFFGLQSGEELREADELCAFYDRLLIDCETLFDSHYGGSITKEEMIKGYMGLRMSEIEKGVRMNSIVRNISAKDQSEINKLTDSYVSRVYGVKPECDGR